jgi:RNA polymerase sigma-70 factor (ECF subfamily)
MLPGLLPELPEPELVERVKNAVERLPPRRRNIFLLSRVEGWTCQQIAESYGISEKKVFRHVAKAMRFVRRRVNPEEFTWWQRWRPF